ncbi:hypothetical protein LJR255_004626 [Pararhizobium sp. LjRoot255]|uniref:hypothetical protein n=1 Tax=Pararhizobium sp. LjRoot255 TaxID=3342298 RepID=UPI003ED0A540
MNREFVRTFVMAAQAGDIQALSDIVCRPGFEFDIGPAALRAAARLPSVPWLVKKILS